MTARNTEIIPGGLVDADSLAALRRAFTNGR
jgi:hypothetical protein